MRALLVDAGANVNYVDVSDDEKRPLHKALNSDVARALLQAEADVNATDADGNTPLHYARSVAIAQELLAYGADIDARNNYGSTPLLEVRFLQDDVMEFLIKSGADVTIMDDIGDTFLHMVKVDHLCQLALHHGGNPCAVGPMCRVLKCLVTMRRLSRPRYSCIALGHPCIMLERLALSTHLSRQART